VHSIGRGSRLTLALAGALAWASCAGPDAGPSGVADLAAIRSAGSDGGCASDVDCRVGLRCDVAAAACVACLLDDDCPPGSVCADRACRQGCADTEDCPTGLRCCGHACADTLTDGLHCGDCGLACPTVAHGHGGCAAGSCGAIVCEPLWGDCDGDPTNGCEADLSSDVARCGGCTTRCVAAHASTLTCQAGRCLFTCDDGWQDCDQLPANGCEAHPADDAANCGSCAQACPGLGAPFALVACAASTCSFACSGENYDVDHKEADGCERVGALGHHTAADAFSIGTTDCYDSHSQNTVTGVIAADTRVHVPAIPGFDPTVGAAPYFYTVFSTGGSLCQDDYSMTFSATGGGGTPCYRATIHTDKRTDSVTISGGSSATTSSGSGAYSDNTSILFTVEKICSLPIEEYVTYTLSYHL
jgi:hypothetical protein